MALRCLLQLTYPWPLFVPGVGWEVECGAVVMIELVDGSLGLVTGIVLEAVVLVGIGID